MKLRNKQTGEIVEVITGDTFEVGGIQIRSLKRNPQIVRYYPSLAELSAEWEDAPEEPKWYWYIDWTPEIGVYHTRDVDSDADKRQKEIGNYFETKEEAEKAVEKLKALKRLKDKGFRFKMWEYDDRHATEFPCILIRANKIKNCEDDLDLLFGGEE